VLFSERNEKVTDRDFAPLSVTKEGVVPQLGHVAKTQDNDNRKRVVPGDFVINSRSDRKGSSGISELEGSTSVINIVLVPSKEIDGGYCHQLLRSVPFQEEFYRNGKGIVADLWSTRFNEMKSIWLPLPPLPEQRVIADYLDAETGRIDTLISEQRELIELLKEKRQALISHCVTRGLDPDVPMKDSGVEWLGEVPEHWEVASLKYLAKFQDHIRVPLSSEVRADMEKIFPYYGASGIIDYVDDYLFDGDRLLVAEDGANLLLRSTPLAFIARGQYWVNNHAHILMPEKLTMAFATHALNSFDYAPWISGSAQPKLTSEALGAFLLPVPPLPEQHAIADYLDKETARIDALIREAEETITLMQEHRSALISACVTGKVKVPGVADPAAEEQAV
jgi:type I restriction enzyme S subunit